MQQILDFLLSKNITHKMINNLELLIEAHTEAYLKIFGVFKPKTHSMLHYVECLRSLTPWHIFGA